MSASVEGAKKLGEKLLVEVEVEDLSSVLRSLRELNAQRNENQDDQTIGQNSFFGISELDALLPSPLPPTLELVSLPPAHHPSGAGKTSLLYLIIAYAILPAFLSPSIPLGGQDAAIIHFDPLHHFSIPRLVSVMLTHIKSSALAAGHDISSTTTSHIKSVVKQSLIHVHIFRPQSWPAFLATLRSLPDYLFDKDRHKSMHRRIHAIILEDVDAFVWPIRNASTTTSTYTSLSTASTHLTTGLQKLSALLSCGVVLTSHSVSPSTFRPALPTSWPQGTSVARLAVRRVEVLKFAPAISIEEAEGERHQRGEVVSRGRFECWKVGTGMKDGEGFLFRVGRGVEVEKREQ